MKVLPDRFWLKVSKTESCWLWNGSTNKDGYGYYPIAGKLKAVHRATYEAFIGPIPDGLEIDHLCSVRACCNPSHLEPVTHAENIRRGRSGQNMATRTHCPKGHEYTPENTGRYRKNYRYCKRCNNRPKKKKTP